MGPLHQPDKPWQDRIVTTHFHLGEFACDHTSKPPALAVPSLVRLCDDYLEPLRARFGVISVNSGCRSRAHNRAVGGAPASWHLWRVRGTLGVAADVRCRHGGPRDWYAFLDKLGIPGLGLYPTFVHADNRAGARARWHG